MEKIDMFKEFVNKKPFVKKLVDQKKFTWQELYERYDKNGENDIAFIEPNKEEKASVNNIFDVLSSIDVDKLADSLNSMKKILSVISEITAGEDSLDRKRKNNRKED